MAGSATGRSRPRCCPRSGAILLTFLVAVAAILVALSIQTEARQWTQHTRDVIEEMTGIMRSLHEADLDVRDINMSGGSSRGDDYRRDVAMCAPISTRRWR